MKTKGFKKGLSVVLGIAVVALAGGIFLFSFAGHTVLIDAIAVDAPNRKAPGEKKIINADIEPQKPLASAPVKIKGIYLTSWSAGNDKKISEIIELSKKHDINTIVIDLKDYSGYVSYDSNAPGVLKYNTKEPRIRYLNALIKRLHDNNIYVIGRVTVFEDPVLARARPDLAVHSKKKIAALGTRSASTLWLDQLKLAWLDPSSPEVWDYIIEIAVDASSRGIDELNFDYIRFPSDGNLDDMFFPLWEKTTPRTDVIKDFFAHLRGAMPNQRISADIFGMALVVKNDMGIGQLIEDAYKYFDYVSPMVYPSHFSQGFSGFKNPAQHPYEVVKYSMENGLARLRDWQPVIGNSTSTAQSLTASYKLPAVKLRPWLQAFDLGATYNSQMVNAQARGVEDALNTSTSTPGAVDGYLLWNPSNNYSKFIF